MGEVEEALSSRVARAKRLQGSPVTLLVAGENYARLESTRN